MGLKSNRYTAWKLLPIKSPKTSTFHCRPSTEAVMISRQTASNLVLLFLLIRFRSLSSSSTCCCCYIFVAAFTRKLILANSNWCVWTTQQRVGKLLARNRACLYSRQLFANSLPTCCYVAHTHQFEFANTRWPTFVWRVKAASVFWIRAPIDSSIVMLTGLPWG